ncbi:MAG TPA: hypothetical protein VGC46_02955 [Allosphingosinicella sp.]
MGGRRKKRRWWKDSAADGAGNAAELGVEAAADGCGCDINLMIAFVLIAGIPLLLWTS